MKFSLKVVLITAVLAATAVYAADRADPNAIARSETMRAIGGAMKTLGGMAEGKVDFDAAAAGAAKDAMMTAAANIPASFTTQGAADPESKAKPEVWTNWADFAANAAALSAAATALDVSSAESIGAGMGALGGACKDCHTEFRM
jgi:cytochrome c556